MDHRSRFSALNASYDEFLFAPVCEDANGMRLSVDYEVRKPVVSNIDLIGHFEKTVTVGGKTSANAP